MPVGKITDEWFFVSGIDVLASHETGGVAALGEVIDLALFDYGDYPLPSGRPDAIVLGLANGLYAVLNQNSRCCPNPNRFITFMPDEPHPAPVSPGTVEICPCLRAQGSPRASAIA